jgi:hypothetical protein
MSLVECAIRGGRIGHSLEEIFSQQHFRDPGGWLPLVWRELRVQIGELRA